MPVVVPWPPGANLVGGLRTRMIRDSLRNMIVGGLTDLGWFATGRRHLPIQLKDRPNKWDTPIPLNSLVIALEDRMDDPTELGSNLTTDTWTAYVDFYAESDDLGLSVSGDIRDILRGKISTIGATRGVLECFDYRTSPAPKFATIDIVNVMDDRAREFPNEWQAHWFVVRCDLEDEYMDETG